METLPSTQIYSAIALQTLALPMTLLLCITSMLRERSINHQDEKRLVRLYKQHAFMFELVQFFVALMACGFVAGNTLAALEARSLVIGFASEDVTAMIVRSAISRNLWLVASAWCVLACVSMLDGWSLPGSLEDLTEPMFRLTREVVRGYIWRHDHDESQIYDNDDDKPLSYDVEQLRPPPPPTDKVSTTETPDPSTLDTPPINPIETTNPPNNKFETPPTAPPTPTEEKDTCFPDLQALVAKTQSQPQSQTHPSAQTSTITTHPPAQTSTTTTHHPPASHPRYQNQTLTSALRATPKSPKARSRQRSVTFDLKGEGVKSCKRESSVVREKVRGSQEGEKSTTIDGGEVGQEEEEERLSSSVSSSSIKEDGFEDGSLTRSEGELGAGSE